MTVQEMLQLIPSSLVKVASGLGGLQREVTQIGIMDAPDIAEWVKPGEFLVTTGYALHGDVSAFCRLVSRLSAANCSGFGLKIHRYWDEFPQEVMSLGKELNFPLIEISPTVKIADIVDSMQYAQKSGGQGVYLGGSLSLPEFLLRLRNGHLSSAQIRFWAQEFRISLNSRIVAFELKGESVNAPEVAAQLAQVFGWNYIFHKAMEHATLSIGFISLREGTTVDDLKDCGIHWYGSHMYLGTEEATLFEYSVSARKAEMTRYLGNALMPQAHFVMYQDIAPLAILHAGLDMERANSIIERTILPIAHYDQVHNSEWLPTLSAYFDNAKSAHLAARVLNTHKNTVIYRINRLEEHFGINLEDMATTFKLYLGLMLYRLQHLTMD